MEGEQQQHRGWQDLVAAFVAGKNGVEIDSEEDSGGPDLTLQQKTEALKAILQKDAALFLHRWGTVLTDEHLSHFVGEDASLEAKYYVDTIRKRRTKQTQTNHSRTRNRRLEYIYTILEDTDYFSLEEMSHRRPALYEEYVGQYLTPAEIAAEVQSRPQQSWATQLMSWMVGKEDAIRREHTREIENWPALETEGKEEEALKRILNDEKDENIEEFDTDDEEANGSDKMQVEGSNGSITDNTKAATEEEAPRKYKEISPEEKESLRADFERMMREFFIAGDDVDFFDYSKVDNDPNLDDMELEQQDAEDAYFDEL